VFCRMPYIQPWKGSLRFRRRVPDHLVGLIGKREWVQSLGTKNRAEANRLVIPHIERTNEDIRDAEQDNWPRIDDGRLSDISGQWWQWHLEVGAKWLRLPVRLVESSIDGHTIALTGDGELGDSLTRFISDRGLEVRPNSSAFARLKRECQILHHERTGGYYHEIGARQNATNKILDAIDNLEVEPQQVAALIEGTPVRPASATGRVASYRWPDLIGDWARETRAKENTKYSWTKIVNKLTAHMGHDDAAAGAIIATIEDYAVVRGLVADLFSEGIEAMVSTTVRETVDAISALKQARGLARRARGEAWARQERRQSSAPASDRVGVPRQSRDAQRTPRPDRAGRCPAGRGAGVARARPIGRVTECCSVALRWRGHCGRYRVA
jgi:hypothetical protein